MPASELVDGATYTASQLSRTAPGAITAELRRLAAAANTPKPQPAEVRPDPLDALMAEAEQPVDTAGRMEELLRAAG